MPKERYTSIGSIGRSKERVLDDNFEKDLEKINLYNANISSIIKAVIPQGATKRILVPSSNIKEGFEYTWRTEKNMYKIRFHSADRGAPPGSNAANGWVVRIRRGNYYMDCDGNFHPPGIYNINSPHFNEAAVNSTHIPVNNDIGYEGRSATD